MDTVADLETALWHYARPLPEDRREAFCAAAQSALARLHCLGPGVAHRTLAELLPSYFVPGSWRLQRGRRASPSPVQQARQRDPGAVSYWGVARLLPQREALALHCLRLSKYQTYLPRLKIRRLVHGRRITVTPPLFPGYLFVAIQDGRWWDARWSPGVISLIMDGITPARLPQSAIDEIRRREVGGLIELERKGVKRGDRVRILRGPFEGHLAILSRQQAARSNRSAPAVARQHPARDVGEP